MVWGWALRSESKYSPLSYQSRFGRCFVWLVSSSPWVVSCCEDGYSAFQPLLFRTVWFQTHTSSLLQHFSCSHLCIYVFLKLISNPFWSFFLCSPIYYLFVLNPNSIRKLFLFGCQLVPDIPHCLSKFLTHTSVYTSFRFLVTIKYHFACAWQKFWSRTKLIASCKFSFFFQTVFKVSL